MREVTELSAFTPEDVDALLLHKRQLRELRSDPVLPTLGQQEVLDELVRRIQAATGVV